MLQLAKLIRKRRHEKVYFSHKLCVARKERIKKTCKREKEKNVAHTFFHRGISFPGPFYFLLLLPWLRKEEENPKTSLLQMIPPAKKSFFKRPFSASKHFAHDICLFFCWLLHLLQTVVKTRKNPQPQQRNFSELNENKLYRKRNVKLISISIQSYIWHRRISAS